MKPPGKGKISSEQSIHIYLRISRNLEDEIFPKWVGVVTPKFLFGFFKKKDFYLTWREWFLKNFLKRTLTLKYFSLWQKLYLNSPKICLWPWRFLLSLGLKTKWFSFGKITFENLFLNLHYGFWKAFCHFQQFLFAMAQVQMISPNSSLTSGSWFTSNPASWTSPCIYFPFKFYSNIFCLLFYHLEIYKGTPFSVLTFTTKRLSPPSPLNPQPGTMKIHWSPVQNFQTTSAASLDQICQIWWNSFKTFSKNSK